MKLVVYVSHCKIPKDNRERSIQEILDVAQLKNKEFGVTGVLFFYQEKFMQVIEGENTVIDQLMRNIRQDRRHENISILIDQSIKERGFDRWDMDAFDLSSKNEISTEEFRAVTEAYQNNFTIRSNNLVDIYKTMATL